MRIDGERDWRKLADSYSTTLPARATGIAKSAGQRFVQVFDLDREPKDAKRKTVGLLYVPLSAAWVGRG